MKYYAKVSAKNSLADIKNKFSEFDIDFSLVLIDEGKSQKTENSVYSKLKQDLLTISDSVIFDSLFSIGKNSREIVKELKWFREHNIEVYVLDIPSTLNEDAKNVEILEEVNDLYAKREIDNLKKGQAKAVRNDKKIGKVRGISTGRPRLPYPPNWVDRYDAWKNGEISSAQFREDTGLSQGSFYNLLRQYNEELGSVKFNDIKKQA